MSAWQFEGSIHEVYRLGIATIRHDEKNYNLIAREEEKEMIMKIKQHRPDSW